MVNETGVRGIEFKFGNKKNIVLGAGTSFDDDEDSFRWIDHWNLYQGKVFQGAGDSKPPTLKGDALRVGKSESFSGIIYWDGSKFKWYQQGD